MREISRCPVEIVSKDLAVMSDLPAVAQPHLLSYEAAYPCRDYRNQPSFHGSPFQHGGIAGQAQVSRL